MTAGPPSLALSTAALVAANLLPLAGVLLGWWAVHEILLLFWAENLVIGVLQLARMGVVLRRRRAWELLPLMPFFCVHYGGFALGHGVILSELFVPAAEGGAAAEEPVHDLFAFLLAPLRHLAEPDGLLLALLALAASHAFSFVANFLGGGEWRTVTPRRLMGEPYLRVVVLHVVLIVGAGAVVALGEPMVALALLVAIKIAVDALAHRRQRGI